MTSFGFGFGTLRTGRRVRSRSGGLTRRTYAVLVHRRPLLLLAGSLLFLGNHRLNCRGCWHGRLRTWEIRKVGMTGTRKRFPWGYRVRM